MTAPRRSNARKPVPTQIALPGFGVVGLVVLEQYGHVMRWTLKSPNGDAIATLEAWVNAVPEVLLAQARKHLPSAHSISLLTAVPTLCYELGDGRGPA